MSLSKSDIARLRIVLNPVAPASNLDDLPDLMTPLETHRVFGVEPATLRFWANTGRISAVRNGANGRRLYSPHEVNRHLVERSQARRLRVALRVSEVAPHRVPATAAAFAVTRTAARQLLDGEVNCSARLHDRARTDEDRWRYEHRRGMRP